jgi:hypothetical protein
VRTTGDISLAVREGVPRSTARVSQKRLGGENSRGELQNVLVNSRANSTAGHVCRETDLVSSFAAIDPVIE